MGISKEIKYAVNSSLGTGYFKSLSDIMKKDDVVLSVRNASGQQDTEIPIYYDFGQYHNFGNDFTETKLKSFCDGEFYLSANIVGSSNQPTYALGLKIYINDELVKQIDISYGGVTNHLVAISNGDEIKILLDGEQKSRLQGLQIRAYEKNLENLIELI